MILGLGLGLGFRVQAGGVSRLALIFAEGEVGDTWLPEREFCYTKTIGGVYENVTTTGDETARWTGSVNGINYDQDTVPKRPLYSEGGGLSWLAFGATGKTMITPTITPGTDKVQTFTALLKTDSAARMILETSTNAGSTNGSFYVLAGEDNAARYTALGGGTSGGAVGNRIAKILTASSYPETSVITATADIAGDSVHIRKNGVEGVAATGDMGTGNFLAYQLNLGSRNQNALFLNGNIYAHITRFGPNLSAPVISEVEGIFAGRAGL
jgi:hypothetical protein